MELNRAMRNNWTLRTNYTYGENNGNNFGNGDGTVDEDDFFDGIGGVEAGTPAPISPPSTARAAATPIAPTT